MGLRSPFAVSESLVRSFVPLRATKPVTRFWRAKRDREIDRFVRCVHRIYFAYISVQIGGCCDNIPGVLRTKPLNVLYRELNRQTLWSIEKNKRSENVRHRSIRQTLIKFGTKFKIPKLEIISQNLRRSSWWSSGTLANSVHSRKPGYERKDEKTKSSYERNSSRVVTCREHDRSRRQSMKQSSTTNARTHRALTRRWNSAGRPIDLSDFATSRYSFQNILQIFVHGNMFSLPWPLVSTPRMRVRGERPSPPILNWRYEKEKRSNRYSSNSLFDRTKTIHRNDRTRVKAKSNARRLKSV